jgi:hypothetical protein
VSLPLAHAGHWLAQLIYAGPVLVVVGALVFQWWRDKRDPSRLEARRTAHPEGDEPPVA